MQISEVIDRIKNYHDGKEIDPDGNEITESTTRDKVLFGDVHQECTGIVTSAWASVDVIKQAIKLGANLIISHEAIFWNHGDHQDWLQSEKNQTYEAKIELLASHHIVVWRDHDHIHYGGIPVGGKLVDGIFYGVAQIMGWTDYQINGNGERFRDSRYRQFEIPTTTVRTIADKLIQSGNLNGAKVYGSLDTKVTKVIIPGHNLGAANDLISKIDKEDINLVLGMEVIDFTLAEYIRDSSMLGIDRAMVTVGHFNLEEFGMKYMLNYLPKVIDAGVDWHFVQSGDMYNYVV